MAEPRVVAGGTVAALVAADTLAAGGAGVRLLLPRKGVGGGFSSLRMQGRVLERGLRVLELHYEGVPAAPPPLEAYEPGEAGHREHVAHVAAWAAELAGDALVEVAPPRSYVRGRLWPELSLSADLAPLADVLGPEDAARAAEEAASARRELGDAGVLDDEEALWSLSVTDASLRNHGATVHDALIAPHVAKVRPRGGDDVLAALRRKVWMPLYWPATVQEAAEGGPIAFEPRRTFHTLTGDGTGRLVDLLVARLEASPRVTVERYDALTALRPDDDAVALTLDGLGEVVADRPVLGFAAGELHTAAGAGWDVPRAESVLHWVGAAEDDVLELPGFVHVHDADVPAFRISPGARHDDGTRTLCLELAHDATEDAAPAASRAALERCGLVREGAPLASLAFFRGPTYAEPTAAAVAAFDAAHARLVELGLDAEVVGGGETFGSDSLNEQVVQGLRAAARLAP